MVGGKIATVLDGPLKGQEINVDQKYRYVTLDVTENKTVQYKLYKVQGYWYLMESSR
jgi:hypothetical protein